ncbi:hypothetical protein N9N03_02680, partial [Chlamydiia bacterium]|nr:hypothetical protein [Chlamydiia bacterium]
MHTQQKKTMSSKIVRLNYNGHLIPVPITGVVPYTCSMIVFRVGSAGFYRCFKNSTQYLVLDSEGFSKKIQYLVAKHFVVYHTRFAYPRQETTSEQFSSDVITIFEDEIKVELDPQTMEALHTDYVTMHPQIFYSLLVKELGNSDISLYLKEMYFSERRHRSDHPPLWPPDFINTIDIMIHRKEYHSTHVDFVIQLTKDICPKSHQVIEWVKKSNDVPFIIKLIEQHNKLDFNQNIDGKSLFSHAILNQEDNSTLGKKATYLLQAGVAPTTQETKYIEELSVEFRSIINLGVALAYPNG